MIKVYVPRSPWLRATIDAGSAVVGEGDARTVWYEGNRFGAVNIVTFADRAKHATSRMDSDYPTTAIAHVSPDDVIEVGWFDGHVVHARDTKSAEALAGWIGSSDPAEMRATS